MKERLSLSMAMSYTITYSCPLAADLLGLFQTPALPRKEYLRI